MCEHTIEHRFGERKSKAFIKALVENLRDLESLVEDESVETNEKRIDAKQELSDRDHKHATA